MLAAHGAAGPATVSAGYLPVLGAALQHGPWIAGLCAFAVTPGALIVIARVLERRWLVPREQFAAVTYGDPLLAKPLTGSCLSRMSSQDHHLPVTTPSRIV